MTGPVQTRRVSRSTGCREDHHCPAGYYCEVSQLLCRECLSCEVLKREPRNLTSCVTSATACGACLTGLVPGPANNSCVSPNEGQILLPYEWAIIIGFSLLLAVIICVAALYVLRNFNAFKILASTRAEVNSPVDVEASAPPSYDVATLPPREQLPINDEAAPFIKPIPSSETRDARVSDGNQTARVFNNPSYVRNLQPHSHVSPHETLPMIEEADTDVNSNAESHSSENAMPIEEPVLAGKRSVVMQASSTKDTNNNGSQDSNNESQDARDANFACNGVMGTTFFINVIKNVNTVQQAN